MVIFGPPGAGKGTQAGRIAGRFGVPHIATGDLLRDAVARGTELGVKANGFMERGELVPDEIVVGIVEERLRRPDCKRGFVLDGFPRTLAQAKALDKILEKLEARIDAVIDLETSEGEIVKRLSNRRVCRVCGAVYHLIFNPPKNSERCDRCGGELYQREDDREEVIKRRLQVYRMQTRPIIDYYQERGVLITVDGNRSIEEVSKSISELLEKLCACARRSVRYLSFIPPPVESLSALDFLWENELLRETKKSNE